MDHKKPSSHSTEEGKHPYHVTHLPFRVRTTTAHTTVPASTALGAGGFGTVHPWTNNTDHTSSSPHLVLKQYEASFNKADRMFVQELALSRVLADQLYIMPCLGAVFSMHKKNKQQLAIFSRPNHTMGLIMPAACESLADWWYADGKARKHRIQQVERTPTTETTCTIGVSKESLFPYLAYQLIAALATTHAHGILHLDVKPHNCLVMTERKHLPYLMLSDFGLSQLWSGSHIPVLSSPHVVSAGWRSPELTQALQENKHMQLGPEQDMWAVGVTLCDLLAYCNSCEIPNGDRYTYDASTRLPRLYEYIYRQSFLKDNVDLYDLLAQLLSLSPMRRISAADALKHPFFRKLGVPERCAQQFGPVSLEVRYPHTLITHQIWPNFLRTEKIHLQLVMLILHQTALRKSQTSTQADEDITFSREGLACTLSEMHQITETSALAVALWNTLVQKVVITPKYTAFMLVTVFLAEAIRNGKRASSLYVWLRHPHFVGRVSYQQAITTLMYILETVEGNICVPSLFRAVRRPRGASETIHLATNYIILAMLTYSGIETDVKMHSLENMARFCEAVVPLFTAPTRQTTHFSLGETAYAPWDAEQTQAMMTHLVQTLNGWKDSDVFLYDMLSAFQDVDVGNTTYQFALFPEK